MSTDAQTQIAPLLPPSLRLTSFTIALACAGVLAFAAYLSPDPRGFGTHEQLGLPPCVSQYFAGFPCPMCGMTTSFALMADARAGEAFHAQPAGAVLFIACVLFFAGSIVAVITGRVPERLRKILTAPRLIVPAALLLAIAWIYKLLFE